MDNKIEYSISGFKGFDAIVFKDFEVQYDEKNIPVGGIPFINDGLVKSINNLMKRIENFKSSSINTYKPWTILLINGDNLDSLDESANLIMDVMKSGKMTYFPFALSDCEFDKSLFSLRKIKPFTIIKDEKFTELFNWIFDIAKSRVEKPANEPISISPNSFEGWTIK